MILLLLACTPLVGAWEGTLSCGDVEEFVSFDLAWADSFYDGEGVLRYAGEAGGVDTTLEVEFDVEVEPSVESDGTLHVDASSTRCSAAQADGSVEFPCTDDLDAANDFLWDRADTIGVSGNCSGSLDRQ